MLLSEIRIKTLLNFLGLTKLVLIFSVLFFSAPLLAKTENKEAASTDEWNRRDAFVNPEAEGEKIIQEWRGGSWGIEGVEGHYRFIITRHSDGRDKLYLQWYLKNGDLAYSMSVKELNIQPEYSLSLPQCEDGAKCQKIKVVAKHYYESTRRTFRIRLDGLGRYLFSF
ncbi:MAG: hypothetical protein K6L76_02640 [Agarilytica sp.]